MTDIAVTLAVDMFDQATAGRETRIALSALAEHHERPSKTEPGAGRWGGVSFARFREGPCGCGAAPIGDRKGCPDFARNADAPHHGHRIDANALAVTALGLDLDKLPGGAPLDEPGATAAIARIRELGVRAVAYSTHSFSPPDRCALRVVFALSREVLVSEWPRFRDAAYGALALPPGCRPGARHFWWLPSCAPGAPRWAEVFEGVPLDVDAILAAAPPPIERSEIAPLVTGSGIVPEETQRAEAARALAAVWPSSGRHAACLALLGGLAREGWPADEIAEFAACVMALGPGAERMPFGEECAKQRSQAERTIEKIRAGVEVAAWGALADVLDDPEAADRVRGMLHVPDPVLASAKETLNALALPPAPEVGSFAECCQHAYVDVVAALAANVGGSSEIAPLFQSGDAILDAVHAPTPWLVKGLVKRGGVCVVGGEPKTGKSWALTEIAIAVASGSMAFEQFPATEGVAMYLYAEDIARDVQTHVRALCTGREGREAAVRARARFEPSGRFLDLTRPEDIALVVASVRWRGGADLVCLEPLRDLHSGEEDSSDSMRDVMRALRVISVLLTVGDRAVTVATAHHTKKPTEGKKPGRGGNALRGSSAIFGALDCLISLANPSGDGETEFISEVESVVRGARSAGFFDLTLRVEDDQWGSATKATWHYSKQTREEKTAALDRELEDRVLAKIREFRAAAQPCNLTAIRGSVQGGNAPVGDAVKRLTGLTMGDPRRIEERRLTVHDKLQRPIQVVSLVIPAEE